MTGHPGPISAVSSHPATPAAVGTTCADGTLRLWDIPGAGAPVQVTDSFNSITADCNVGLALLQPAAAHWLAGCARFGSMLE